MINLNYVKDFISNVREVVSNMEGEIYLVGGYIRDKLISITAQPKDVDFVFNGNIEELMCKLEGRQYKFFPIKQEEGIYRCILGNNSIDVSLMKGNSIEEDLKSRDFTMNAIAISLSEDKVRVIDPFYGKRSIENRIIKSVTDTSLQDDPIRILRGIRFYICYGMHFNLDTEKSIEKLGYKIMKMPMERVFKEFMLILEKDRQGKAFEILDNYRILKNIIPYIEELKTIGKCAYHIEDVFTHMNLTYCVFKDLLSGKISVKGLNLNVFENKIGEFKLKEYMSLACFLHDIGKYEAYRKDGNKVSFWGHETKGAMIARDFCRGMKFPQKGEQYIEKIVDGHMYPLKIFKQNPKNRKGAFYEFFSKYNGYVIGILTVAYCDNYATRMFMDVQNEKVRFKMFIEDMLKEYKLYCTINEDKILNGNDVIEILNISGPKVKDVLEDVMKLRYLGKIESRKEALNYLKVKINDNYI